MGNNGKSDRLYFLELQNHCGLWLQPWNKKTLVPWRKNYDKPRQHIKKQRHYFADKVLSSQSCGFPISRVQVWELDFKEGWVPNNWCFWTVMLEKILYSPLDIKEINQSILKEINPEYALAGLKLKLQYFGHLQEELICWKRLICRRLWTGGEGDDRGWDGWMASLTGREIEKTLGDSKG